MPDYSRAPNEFIIESRHGAYGDYGWTFVSSRKNLDDAISFAQKFSGQRVVNKRGVVVWPIKEVINA